jgi:hypothetical protein
LVILKSPGQNFSILGRFFRRFRENARYREIYSPLRRDPTEMQMNIVLDWRRICAFPHGGWRGAAAHRRRDRR